MPSTWTAKCGVTFAALWKSERKRGREYFLYAGGDEWREQRFLTSYYSRRDKEETAREIHGAGCTWYPGEQPLSTEAVWLSRSAKK